MANKKQCINSGLDFSIIKNFNGDGTENAQLWFQKLEFLLKNKNITDESACSTLPLLLNDNALNWFISLPDNVKENFIDLKAAFLDRYGPNKSTRWFMVSELYKMKQEQNEKVLDFISKITASTMGLDIPQNQLKEIILQGLKPEIRQFILQKEENPNISNIQKYAKMAEEVCFGSQNTTVMSAIERIEDKLQQMTSTINSVTANRERPSRNRNPPYQRIECRKCGQFHKWNRCPAYGKTCKKCGKLNHFAKVCRSANKTSQQPGRI